MLPSFRDFHKKEDKRLEGETDGLCHGLQHMDVYDAHFEPKPRDKHSNSKNTNLAPFDLSSDLLLGDVGRTALVTRLDALSTTCCVIGFAKTIVSDCSNLFFFFFFFSGCQLRLCFWTLEMCSSYELLFGSILQRASELLSCTDHALSPSVLFQAIPHGFPL